MTLSSSPISTNASLDRDKKEKLDALKARKLKPGMNLWQLNLITGALNVAKFDDPNDDYLTNYLYVEASSLKAAQKKYRDFFIKPEYIKKKFVITEQP